MHSTEDELERRLREAAPPTTPITGDLTVELHKLAHASRGRAGWRRLLRGTPLTIGVVLAVGLGGAGVATAAGVWSGWAADPDAIVTYTLPSGAICEHRLGNSWFPDPDAHAEAPAVFSSLAVQDLDLAEELSTFAIDSNTATDAEYRRAMSYAISSYVIQELSERGFDTANGRFDGVATCTGAEG